MGLFDIFGGGDAVDEAGDAQQARIVQAIDLINDRLEQARDEKKAGMNEYIDTVQKTIADMKTEILAGNTVAASQLKTGLDEQISFLSKTYNFQEQTLLNAYESIGNDLKSAETEATGELTSGRDIARTDLTTGRDTALTTLRSSLTSSLDYLTQGTDKASQAIRDSLTRTRQTYAPYIAAGSKAIERAEQLTNDPQAQLDYVQNNPFFKAMQETARDNLFANQAARGRLGTGGTLDELDKRTLLLGEQLVGNAVNRNTTISGQGLNAANNQVGADTNLSNLLASIFQNAGVAGAGLNENYGARASAIQANTGGALADLETRYAENVAGQTNNRANALAEIGANFTGMLSNTISNLGMAGFGATSNYWNNLFNQTNASTQQMAGLTGEAGMAKANAEAGYRDYYSNLIMGGAGSVADLLLELGNSEAGEAIGEQNANMQGLNTLINIAALMSNFPPVAGSGQQTPQYQSTPQGAYGPMAGGYQYGQNAFGGYGTPYMASPTYFNPTQYTPLNISFGA